MANKPDLPRSEIQARIQQSEEKSLRTLKETVRTLAETEQIADATGAKLHEQTEQMHRIQSDADDTIHNLNQSEYLLRGMKSTVGWFKNMFRSPPAPPPKTNSGGYVSDQASGSGSAGLSRGAAAASARASAAKGTGGYPGAAPSTSSGTTSTSSTKLAEGKPTYKEEEDKALDTIENMLAGLKDRSLGISQTLEHQDKLLDGIQDTTSRAQDKQRKVTKDLKSIK